MSNVFAGSDGSFMSSWQAWKRRNHEPETFVMPHEETMVFRTADGEYVWYHGIEEDDLPDGVELAGVSVRDRRE
jgi:hypothetical protein